MAENLEFNLNVKKDDLSKALESATSKTFSLTRALEVAAGSFAGGLAIKGFELLGDAVNEATDFLFESVTAAAESEQSFKKLEIALAQTGQLTEQNVTQFRALADEIQRTSAFEDDAVISAGALIQTLGRLSGEGLREATKAATDLSAALEIDLESAAQLVGKAATGNITAFGKLGIEIRKGSTDAETFANTLQVLNSRFSGSAANQVQTFSGALSQLKNIYGDLKETIGGLITSNPALIAAFNTFKTILVNVGNSIKDAFSGDNSTAIADLFRFMLDGSAAVLTAFDALFRGIDFSINAILSGLRTLALGIVGPVAGILELAASIPGVGDNFKSMADTASAEVERLTDKIFDNSQAMKEAFSKDTLTSGLVDGIAETRNTFDQYYNDVITKAPEIKNSLGGGDTVDQEQLDQINKERQLQAEITNIQLQGDIERNLLTEQMAIAAREAEGVRRAEDIEALASYEQSKIDIALQAEIEKNNLILNQRERDLANQKAIENAKLASQRLASKTSLDIQKFNAQQEQQIQQTRINALQGFLNAGLTLAKQGSREAKALQTASAIVSTYTAANQALSSPPGPPFTLPLVAATIAQGLANVSKINSQSFATGGIVKGSSEVGDRIPVNVNAKEMILNQEQQANLFNMINNGGSIGGNIVVQIDGREVFKAVRNQLQNGMSF